METLASTSLHMSAKIHVFFLTSFNPWDWVSSKRGMRRIHPFFSGWLGGGGGDACDARVVFMFPQSGAVEAPKDQVMIQVVPGVLDRHIPEDTEFRPQDVVCPGPYLST